MKYVSQSNDMPNTPTDRANAPTLPPGPADAAAFEHARRLVATGADRTADFWAVLERRAAEVGVKR